jgi:hypothetical protein
MNYIINFSFKNEEKAILNFLENYSISGKVFDDRQRNQIRLFNLNENIINIKSFKKPNLINKIAYRYFRKSKARRSYEYAAKLIELNIGTPQPIAFFENYDIIGLKDSYYACVHLENVFEFREIVQNTAFKNRNEILRQFTKFTFNMHQKGIEFLDHSPGNTLIKDNNDGTYSFYLVDLNRMKFYKAIDFQTRMKNLSRLTPQEEMIAIMSNEYAKLSGEDEKSVFETMWKMTESFQFRYHRKKRLKKKLKFWKK